MGLLSSFFGNVKCLLSSLWWPVVAKAPTVVVKSGKCESAEIRVVDQRSGEEEKFLDVGKIGVDEGREERKNRSFSL